MESRSKCTPPPPDSLAAQAGLQLEILLLSPLVPLQTGAYALHPDTFLNGNFLVDNYTTKSHSVCLRQALKTKLYPCNSALNEKR